MPSLDKGSATPLFKVGDRVRISIYEHKYENGTIVMVGNQTFYGLYQVRCDADNVECVFEEDQLEAI